MSKVNALSEKQDQELVELLKEEGSRLAFEALYIRYIKQLKAFCHRLLKDKMRAEDVAHDVFLYVFETYNDLNPQLSFYHYLQTIARNRIMDEFKKIDVHLRYAQQTILHGNEATNQTENLILDHDYAKFLNDLIDHLTPQQKKVFQLSRIQGMTYNEIASTLNLSLPTVQKHASLALEKIKKQLTAHADLHFKTLIIFLIIFSS